MTIIDSPNAALNWEYLDAYGVTGPLGPTGPTGGTGPFTSEFRNWVLNGYCDPCPPSPPTPPTPATSPDCSKGGQRAPSGAVCPSGPSGPTADTCHTASR